VHTYAFYYCVTLTVELLDLGSVHAERLPCMHFMSAKFVSDSSSLFRLERGYTHTHKVTGASDHSSHVSASVEVANESVFTVQRCSCSVRQSQTDVLAILSLLN